MLSRAVIFAVVFCSPLPRVFAEQPLYFRGSCMGTTYAVTVAGNLEKSSLNKIAEQVSDELERIEQIFSLYRPTSELSRFNEVTSSEWMAVSPDLFAVTKRAIDLAGQSNAAFDPTVAPLVRLWRLQQVTNDWSPPSAQEIAETKKQVGFRLLHLRDDPPAIKRLVAGVSLDLNALVEGWAIDRVIKLLQQNGVNDALVELGGEFRAFGHKHDDQPWKIGIENPLEPGSLYATASLSNAALATSGNYRQSIEYRGRHYGHILNARTASPVEHDLIAVSVLAGDAATADGWATALMILGPAEGFSLAQRKRLAASFVVRNGRELQFKLTAAAVGRILIAGKQ
jgi:thiamine biosynthesis lipoprotein